MKIISKVRSSLSSQPPTHIKVARPGSLTPKAFANCSPGLLQPWDQILNKKLNSERVRNLFRAIFANTFGVTLFHYSRPRLKQPWAAISERLWRKNLV